MNREKDDRTMADRRAALGIPQEEDEPDFAEEHAPGPSFPPIAPADGRGGQAEGYELQTRV
ncbi:hypothetical protein EDD29_3955 [Actinocorallia herbida]|uniref:Uncharacterized protein n=1 Tax=Actinocorallia herbida TaxID=58109 RepID=A0A3N1CYP5_9ACTN|nr:hypothetical protein [Actinocorallia herbida]ROO86390.1 hypothetical protein EDD29_3955 [Actinocorallia herbida]